MNPFHGQSEPAPDRDANQDAFVIGPTTDGGLLLLVCDGMGGMGRGAEASRLATRVLEEDLREGGDAKVLQQALRDADARLRRELVDPGPGRPGCTAVVVLLNGDQATVGWAGDSRALHIRGDKILHHTVDHKLVEELVAAGTLTREQAKGGRMGHVITRCLGARRSTDEVHEPEITETPWRLSPGDALVLCSDGLTDVVDEAEVPGLIAGCEVERAVSVLVREAQERGTADDTTVVVYRHPVHFEALPIPAATRRADPLLQLSTPTRPSGTWPGAPPRQPADPPVSENSALPWYVAAAGIGCILLSGALLAAWLGGLF